MFCRDVTCLPLDRDRILVKVDVLPRKPHDLADAHACIIEEQDRDVKRCACRIFFKDVCDLFRRYDLALYDVLGRGSRHFDVVCWIALDKLSGVDSVVQGIAQDGENQTDRLVCEPICCELQNPVIESSGGELL